MIDQALSRRYARALLDVAGEKGRIEPFAEQLAEFCRVIEGHGDLTKILFGGLFAEAKRKAIVADLARRLGSDDLVRNFIFVLIDKDRLRYLPGIAEQFRALADELAGRARARIVSVGDLDKDVKAQIAARLGEYVGRTVECTFEVEPGLLGGVRAEVGSLVLDGTVRAQLERLTQSLGQG